MSLAPAFPIQRAVSGATPDYQPATIGLPTGRWVGLARPCPTPLTVMPHGTRKTSAHLDPHGQYVFDTRPLGRQPGSTHAESPTVAAPPDLGVELAGVPEGAGIELDLRLEAVMEGVLVSGTARTKATGECARCLDPLTLDLEVGLQELFTYAAADDDDDVADYGGTIGEAADDVHHLDGDLLDLEPVLRDAVVLALPLAPLCREDCPGLCTECGARLADAGPGHGHGDGTDPRWAALNALAAPDQQDLHDELGMHDEFGQDDELDLDDEFEQDDELDLHDELDQHDHPGRRPGPDSDQQEG
jgi:uncharacterized protein